MYGSAKCSRKSREKDLPRVHQSSGVECLLDQSHHREACTMLALQILPLPEAYAMLSADSSTKTKSALDQSYMKAFGVGDLFLRVGIDQDCHMEVSVA